MAGREEKTLTPKEIIHQKFGVKASYMIEEVRVSSQSTCLYRCHLQLPDFSVVSNVFKSKQDSEQSAAELGLEKVCLWFHLSSVFVSLFSKNSFVLKKTILLMFQLGIHPQDDHHITVEEGWDDIVERIKYIFSDEVSKVSICFVYTSFNSNFEIQSLYMIN